MKDDTKDKEQEQKEKFDEEKIDSMDEETQDKGVSLVATNSPNASSAGSQEEVKATDYTDMDFTQLCQVNGYGGDPRIYECISKLFKPDDDKSFDQEIEDDFDAKFIKHLVSKMQSKEVSVT